MKDKPNIVGENVKRLRLAAGESWAQLARAIGARSPNSISAIERGGGSTLLPRIAKHYNVNIADLDPSLEREETVKVSAAQLAGPDEDFPVYAGVEAGDGILVLSNEPIDMIRRPRQFAKVRNAYGVIVAGESMDPAVRPGQTVLVNPALSPLRGDLCVFRREEHGEFRATVKEFLGSTPAAWKVRRYKPRQKDYELDRKTWPECHVVVSINRR